MWLFSVIPCCGFPVHCSGSLNGFDMIPVAHIITGISFVFTVDMRCISIVRPSYYYYYYYYYYCYSKIRTVLQQLTVITLTIHIFYTSQLHFIVTVLNFGPHFVTER